MPIKRTTDREAKGRLIIINEGQGKKKNKAGTKINPKKNRRC